MMSTGQTGATQLLAQMIATVDDPHDLGIGADEFEQLDGGVAATIYLPSGDSYRVSVQWVGDSE